MILSDLPNDCMTCESSGASDLQDLAYRYGVWEIPFKEESHEYEILNDNPIIEHDPNNAYSAGDA